MYAQGLAGRPWLRELRKFAYQTPPVSGCPQSRLAANLVRFLENVCRNSLVSCNREYEGQHEGKLFVHYPDKVSQVVFIERSDPVAEPGLRVELLLHVNRAFVLPFEVAPDLTVALL